MGDFDEEIPPSPIMKGVDKVDEVRTYMLRMTPFEMYSLEDLKQWLDLTTTAWIVGSEQKAGKLHYHCCIFTRVELDQYRKIVLKYLHGYWPTRPRGWGGAQYNLQSVDKQDKAISYSVKDGDYSFSVHIDEAALKQRVNASFAKYDKVEFQKEYTALLDKYKTDMSMKIKDFMVAFMQLKGKYRQPIKMSYIYEVALANEVHRNPQHAINVAASYLAKQDQR